ncbi:MAG: DUF2807 domain-containing protein [Duncaniella sp.]|nr:DUF2807 domain-containing protein [Duncaniella sp.]
MRKSILFLMLALCVGAFSASAESKTLTVKSNYKTIHAFCAADVVYNPTSGTTTTIEITGPSDKIEWVDVTVSKGTLSIGTKKESNGSRNGRHLKGVKITVNGPLVSSLQASSSGKISSTTQFEFRKSTVNLSASSSGEISLAKVTSPVIQAKASSSGEISISTTRTQTLHLQASSSGEINLKDATTATCHSQASSSGDINIKTLKADNTSFQASSSGDIKISDITAGSVSAQASSAGDVEISGKANSLNASASSGADINVKKLSYTQSSVRASSGGSVYER